MTAERDRQLTRRVTTVLRKAYGNHTASTNRPALEELLLGILHDGVPEEQAVGALDALSRSFVDWNETRVGSRHEIAAVMPGIPEAVEKACIIRSVLGNVYARVNEMSLECFREKDSREVAALFADIEGFPEGALSRATMIGLGHAMLPLTPKFLAVCRRLGMLDGRSNRKTLSRRIEKAVSTKNMFEFHWLLSQHAQKVCLAGAQPCAECRLRKDCHTGRKTAAGKTPRRAGAPAKKRKSLKA